MTESTSAANAPIKGDISVTKLIGVGVLTRFIMDTGIQVFFPFLPIIARGLGTSTIALGRLVSLRSATGMLSPLFGELADRYGYKRIMRLGLLLGALGYGLVGLSTQIAVTAVGMVLAGIGTFSFVPTLQAYLSNKLSPQRLARGLGMLEYAWALSGIFGLYLVGQLIEATNWRVPFYIIAVSLLLAALFYGLLPRSRPTAVSTPPTQIGVAFSWRTFIDLGPNRHSAWSAVITQGLIMFSAMHLFINYGTWLTDDYQFTAGQLGKMALMLGLADLSGSVLVSLASDRIGVRRSVLGGVMLAGIAYFLLPILNVGLTAVTLGLLVTRFSFEFSLVSNIALISKQVPAQRGKMLTLSAASALLGSTIAGFSGPLVYARFGVWGLGIPPALMMTITLYLLSQHVLSKST